MLKFVQIEKKTDMSETEVVKQVDVANDSGFDEETDENESLNDVEMVNTGDVFKEDSLSVDSRDDSSNDEIGRIENDQYTSDTESDEREKVLDFFRKSDEDDDSDSECSIKKCLDEEYTLLMDRVDKVVFRVMRKPKCFTGGKYRSAKSPLSQKP